MPWMDEIQHPMDHLEDSCSTEYLHYPLEVLILVLTTYYDFSICHAERFMLWRAREG